MRIGGVPYGVGAPLLAGIEAEPGVQYLQGPPTELIRQLRGGRLDAALVSSIEAVRQPGYVIAAGPGVACRQKFTSARAFRRPDRPIRTVALDQASATSVALLKMLLANRFVDEVAPGIEYEVVPPTEPVAGLPHDLVLRIGDDGPLDGAGDREPLDLGREWVRWTRLPFVFALWVVRADADVNGLLPVLHRARERGRRLEAGDTNGAHYDLDDQDLRGLCRFWDECRELQFASQPNPAFV